MFGHEKIMTSSQLACKLSWYCTALVSLRGHGFDSRISLSFFFFFKLYIHYCSSSDPDREDHLHLQMSALLGEITAICPIAKHRLNHNFKKKHVHYTYNRGGHWGILETAKPKKKTVKPQKKKSAKTENRIQNRQKPIQW